MRINSDSPKIRYTGRWRVTDSEAITTANGSYFEFSFCGECAVLRFDISNCKRPFPHIYISVDNGADIEVTVDSLIRISAECGTHSMRVIMKSSVEGQHRWYAPIESAVRFLGADADSFAVLPEDNRKIIEFIGDSITEGISIDVEYGDSMVYWDDSTAGYAWLTAKSLDMRPVIMGYGCLGTTRRGAGNVPPVNESYGFYSDGYETESANADFIVINHGTNDRNADKDEFMHAYYEFLGTVRKRNPNSRIIALTPFCGALADEIKKSVDNFNEKNADDVFYINTAGWISPEPLHPLREGHKTVSARLTEIIKKNFF